jgi:hypothetical protein
VALESLIEVVAEVVVVVELFVLVVVSIADEPILTERVPLVPFAAMKIMSEWSCTRTTLREVEAPLVNTFGQNSNRKRSHLTL